MQPLFPSFHPKQSFGKALFSRCLSHLYTMPQPRPATSWVRPKPSCPSPAATAHSHPTPIHFIVVSSAVCPHNARPISSRKNFYLRTRWSNPQPLTYIPEGTRQPWFSPDHQGALVWRLTATNMLWNPVWLICSVLRWPVSPEAASLGAHWQPQKAGSFSCGHCWKPTALPSLSNLFLIVNNKWTTRSGDDANLRQRTNRGTDDRERNADWKHQYHKHTLLLTLHHAF